MSTPHLARRNFLKSLSAFGFTAFLPLNLLPKTAAKPKIHFISIGDLSSHILTYLSETRPNSQAANLNEVYSCITDGQFEEYDQHKNIHQLDYENFNRANLLQHKSRCLLLTDLNDAQAVSIAADICKTQRLSGQKCTLIAFLPFLFEGTTSRQKAENRLISLTQQAACHAIDLEKLRQEYGDLPYNEAFQRFNEKVERVLEEVILENFNIPFLIC